MKKIKRHQIILFLLSVTILFGFATDNPYFNITKKNVELHVPKGFPKPLYDFKNNKLKPEAFVLGRKLFYDPILSRDSSTSCGSCHQRIAAFAHIDHSLSHGIDGLIGKRNVPAIQNMIWQSSFMWDGGVNHLETQPISPLTNPKEMDESLEHAIKKIRSREDYRIQFTKAFGDTGINSEKILKSLAQFIGLMISSESRYDHYLLGLDTFSVSEKNGLNLFRLKCSGCHREPLFTDQTYRNNGIGVDTSLRDMGRGAITGVAEDNNKFKVPSLRNIEMTMPYMHDGRFRKLKDVLGHYSGSKPFSEEADSSIYKIGILNETDKKDLLAFLLTLTDRQFLYDRRFADPNMR